VSAWNSRADTTLALTTGHQAGRRRFRPPIDPQEHSMSEVKASRIVSLVPNAYLDLLRRKPAQSPLLGSAIGRLPFGASGIAMLILVQHATGSFASAGVTEAFFTVGAGIGVPAQGRLIDRLGQTPLLLGSAALSVLASVVFVVAAHDGSSLAVLSAVAALAGLAVPPLSICMRALWSDLLDNGAALQSAYALDAVIIELAFICGPLIAAALIALFSAEVAVLASAGLGCMGALIFAGSAASRKWQSSSHEVRHWAGPLRFAGIVVLAGVALAFGFGIGAMELALIAFGKARASASIAGPLISAQAVASLAGGFWFGAHNWRLSLPDRYVRLNLLVALCFLPLALTPSLPVMFLLMLITGVGLAPASAASYALVERLAPRGTQSEAFGWLIAGTVFGIGLGSVIGGAIVNGGHLRLAFLIAFAGMAAAWLVAFAGRGWLGEDD
jgi:MFS family permease